MNRRLCDLTEELRFIDVMIVLSGIAPVCCKKQHAAQIEVRIRMIRVKAKGRSEMRDTGVS